MSTLIFSTRKFPYSEVRESPQFKNALGVERPFSEQLSSGTKKKRHKHKEFGQKPPPPRAPPPAKGPLTPQILYVWGLFSLQNTEKKRPT